MGRYIYTKISYPFRLVILDSSPPIVGHHEISGPRIPIYDTAAPRSCWSDSRLSDSTSFDLPCVCVCVCVCILVKQAPQFGQIRDTCQHVRVCECAYYNIYGTHTPCPPRAPRLQGL